MPRVRSMIGVLVVGAIGIAAVSSAPTEARPAVQTDLDAFMARVLAQRDDNWKKLQQYVLDEHEAIDLAGPGGARLFGERRDYTWYIRDGFFVRSPVAVNGVRVPEADRIKYEADYLNRAKHQSQTPDANAGAANRNVDAAPAHDQSTDPAPAQGDLGALVAETHRPGFIDSAYFLRFTFEPGRYALVGHETLDGRDVLRIEYYPNRLFPNDASHDDARAKRRAKRGAAEDDAITKMMNEISRVTLWIAPDEHQIVKYTFDNLTRLDFLPGAWLLRIDGLHASMTMSQPFAGVWLPETVTMTFGAMLAIGHVDVRYRVDYDGYRQAVTSGRMVPLSR